jgi:hypothetical protein
MSFNLLVKEHIMRTISRISLLLIGVLILSACYPFSKTVRLDGSGEVETLEYEFSDFDRIDSSHVFEVDIQSADAFSVVVSVDEDVTEYLDISVLGGN